MAVMITDVCINCDSCIDECPATAIASASDSPSGDFTYVKPEKCIECVDSTTPKCFDACPTEGAIVWDLAYTAENNDYFVAGHEAGTYNIRESKKLGMMFPINQPRPFRESISHDARVSHQPVN